MATLIFVPALTFLDARAMVLRQVLACRGLPSTDTVALADSHGRVLAADAAADRDYPQFNRSVRDGFAVRASDIPGRLRITGEVRAGERFAGVLGAGEAVEIMTGAPVPEGADAVIMVEHCTRQGDGTVETAQTASSGSNIAPLACEARAGSVVLRRGFRVDHAAAGWLATIGCARVPVYARPRVAILATGDEIVPVDATPAPHQIRNSNSYSLAAQVRRAGGEPVILPVARDEREATADLIAQGLEADLLLLSGGVSAGKYDFVEAALADCGAEFYFDRVLIQPGQPVVFGKARGKFFFGLPGNPASTMVTFELFGRAALELLAGADEAPLPLTLARLTRPFRHKPGLTRFLPAHVSCTEVTPVDWQGSGDIPSLCRANAFLVADPGQAEYAAGDVIPVLLK
ncbi:MAG TPA: gephyrin-like molybdotransferase Glp [Bryobacteraceae bacterium]|nr:gephyrin-like molybdotransferase Glp [Bryobacteraceae bacterium]